MYGNERALPMNGSWRKNVMITGKKSLCKSWVPDISAYIIDNAPEKVEETECLDYHANEGPLEEDQQDPTQETHSPAYFLFPGEEVECLLRPYYERYSRQEENLYTRICK